MHDEPLVLSKVVEACSRNPHREEYPNFLNKKLNSDSFKLRTENQSPEYLMSILEPELVRKFDEAKIRLHSRCLHLRYERDQLPCLEAIKKSKWAGPYRKGIRENWFFVSIINTGDNNYYVMLNIDLTHPPQFILIEFYEGNESIGG